MSGLQEIIQELQELHKRTDSFSDAIIKQAIDQADTCTMQLLNEQSKALSEERRKTISALIELSVFKCKTDIAVQNNVSCLTVIQGHSVSKAIEVIRSTGRPLHVKVLAETIQARRGSLTTALDRAVSRGVLLKTAPATYWLPNLQMEETK